VHYVKIASESFQIEGAIFMKRSSFYLLSLVLAMISCNNTGTKKTSNDVVIVSSENIDTSRLNAMQKKPGLQNKVYYSNPIKRDTIVSNYRISYIIQDNNEIITTYPITDGKGLDTVYYAGREIILDVKYTQGEFFLQKKINRAFFSSYIPNKEISNYSISYFNLEQIANDEKIVFSVSLCVPETDICYWFELYVSSGDTIAIKNITLEEEDM
jgi:hypothetical protein